LVALAQESFGGLDIAFNNAGTEGSGLVPLMDEDIDRILGLDRASTLRMRD